MEGPGPCSLRAAHQGTLSSSLKPRPLQQSCNDCFLLPSASSCCCYSIHWSRALTRRKRHESAAVPAPDYSIWLNVIRFPASNEISFHLSLQGCYKGEAFAAFQRQLSEQENQAGAFPRLCAPAQQEETRAQLQPASLCAKGKPATSSGVNATATSRGATAAVLAPARCA